MTLTTPRPCLHGHAFTSTFRTLVDDIRRGALDRERTRRLPFAEVRALQEIGFGRRRLADDGSPATRLADVFDELIDLAAADSNVAHLYRGHLAFVETLLLNPDSADSIRWRDRILSGDFVGNAQSEKQETAEITTRITRLDGVPLLTGRKFYTTGSIYADWIYLSALDGDERVGVTVRTAHNGVSVVDDWDGFGQKLTGSGTAVFTDVPIDPADITRAEPDSRQSRYLAAVFQLCLLATAAGIAQAALDDTVDFVRPRRRIFGFAGEALPRENELVQAVVGKVASAAWSARAIVRSSADELDRALRDSISGRGTDEAFLMAELNVFKAQQVVLPLVLDATTELFEVGGASAVGTGAALDRHWRNARTVASHNPAVQRARQIGDYHLNDRPPSWQGAGAPAETTQGSARA
ncbi:hypothetical protein D9V29_03680 [Mycetocola manganoxydans]|uniref:Acyl-CoA dehydrogenase C-terminal domain-containing protein n=1 Tax=Mycetocola manganoxydans TaxID=699879 RepID=A0A3L6ZZ74_9MICO|nr:hypothetical protein [Mycetocola manganoxydans]RLP73114.1 hypothetical protein D9V29_03680 [Mycetocola manganoxydans]GHD44039.1 hypothetical protein GCM10008097_11540 [Mycetocola manganoxydans]